MARRRSVWSLTKGNLAKGINCTPPSMDSVNRGNNHQVGTGNSSESHPAQAGRPIGSGVGNNPFPEREFPKKSTRKGRLPSSKDNTSSRLTKPGPSTSYDAELNKAASSKKKVKPSFRAYRDRRAAYKLLDKFKGIPEEKWSDQDKAKLEWALKVTKEHESAATQGSSKRKDRSMDESPLKGKKRTRLGPSPQSNKKGLPNRSYSEIMKNHLVWAVIDRGHRDGSIAPAKWGLVEAALLGKYLDILQKNPGPAPCCRDAGWHQGHIKLVACADQRSLDLYKQAIGEVGEVWPGARIEAVSRDKIPSKPRLRAWIPTEPSDPRTILKIIQTSNPTLPTEDWSVIKVSEAAGMRRQVIVILNEASLAPLAESKGVISYGFGSTTLNVYKSDQRTPIPSREGEPRSHSDSEMSDMVVTNIFGPLHLDEISEAEENLALISPLIITEDNDVTIVAVPENSLSDGGGNTM